MLRLKTLALTLLAGTFPLAAYAQSNPKVLMLSDIHFDPFRNPAQFAALNTSAASDWPHILSAPDHTPESDRAPEPCPSRGYDTDWTLFSASLKAEQTALPHPAFITVSGDLLGHEFDCRYKAMAGDSDNPATYSAFSSKVITFVTAQIRAAFPGTPIYFALGNNDSGCGDYFEDLGSAFLTSAAADFSATIAPGEHKSLAIDLPTDGGDSLALPIPHTRIVILQDLFEAATYKSCARQPAPDAPAKQLAWLRKQLDAARATHENVWLMAHIPTGVNVYNTIRSKANICTGDAPAPFLSSTALADTIAEYADVLKLAVFAHTHNDEIHLFTSADGKRFVPAKIVPSISPINGNRPSFTVAEVNPKTATIADYTVITANNSTGVAATWTESYRFTKAYAEPDFSATSVANLAHKLTTDHAGAAPDSLAYQHLWFPGDGGLHAAAAHLLWPLYSCSITADHAADYRACVCPAALAAKP